MIPMIARAGGRMMLAAALATMSVLGGSASAHASAAADPNDEALQRVGGCIAGGGQGDLLMLMDTSGSLKQTDPTNARVSAAKYLVNQLTSFSASNKVTLNVAVAGFSATYDGKLGWTKLGPGTASVQSALDSFTTANDGADTDYWTALTGARKALAQQATSGGTHCSMLVIFTDGEYSIEPRSQAGKIPSDPKPYAPGNPLQTTADAAAAMKAGEKDLCRPTGLADQVRSDDITTIAVGLSSTQKPDFGLLKGLSVGSGGTACGALTSPAPGAFFEASNIDGLFFAFDQFASPGQRPITQNSGLCDKVGCPGGSQSFVVDSSIGRVHGLASSTVAATTMVLRSPGGKLFPLAREGAHTIAVPGAEASWSWVSPSTVSFDLKRTDDKAWTGQWTISFVSQQAGQSRSSLHLYGDITPVWTNQQGATLRTGQSPALTFGVTHADGSALNPTTLSDKTILDVDLVGHDGKVTPVVHGLKQAAIADTKRVSLAGIAPGPASLRMTLRVTTKPWTSGKQTIPGTVLEPQVKNYAVTVLPPASYPTIPATVDLGTTEGTDEVTGHIPLTGQGCGWIDGAARTTGAPDGVTAQVSSSANGSVSCSEKSIPLSVKPSAVGNGLLSGTVTVMIRGKNADAKPVAQQVAYRLEMQRPANQAVFWPTLIGLTLLGLLIPLALLYAVRFATTKLHGSSVTVGSVRGPIDENQQFLSHSTVLDENTASSVALGGQREIAADGKVFRARMGLAPTEIGYVLVEQPRVPAAGRGGRSRKGSAVLPLALTNTWLVSLDPQSPHTGDVEVTFLVPPDRHGWDELLADAVSEVADVVRALRADLPASTEPPAGDAWDSQGGAPDTWGSSADAPDPWGAGAPATPDPWGQNSASAPAGQEPGGAAPAADPWATNPQSPPGSAGPSGSSGPANDPWA